MAAWRPRTASISCRQPSQSFRCCPSWWLASSESSPYTARAMYCWARSHFMSIFLLPTVLEKVLLASYCWLYASLGALLNESPRRSGEREISFGSSHLCQTCPQFLGRPEERIFCRLFRGIQHFSNRPELKTLIMLQLKDHALSWRQLLKRRLNALAQNLALQLAVGIGNRAVIAHIAEQVHFLARRVNHDGRIFAPRLAPPELVQTQVGHNPVDPGVERALKPEIPDIPEGLKKSLLMDVLRILLRARKVQGQSQYRLIILTHQNVKGSAGALLGFANQLCFGGPVTNFCWHPLRGFYRSRRLMRRGMGGDGMRSASAAMLLLQKKANANAL